MSPRMRPTAGKGFTLIELLVVIAIIGLLASIILASLNVAQQKGRDARRISDLKEVQLALELFYDANSFYPTQGSALSTAPSAGNIPSVLVPSYITQTPTDPTSSNVYFYQYQSLNSDGSICSATNTCQGYLLVAQFEAGFNNTSWRGTITGDPSTLCPATSPGSAPYPYCVHSGG